MRRATIVGGVFATVLVLLALAFAARNRKSSRTSAPPRRPRPRSHRRPRRRRPPTTRASSTAGSTTVDGGTLEGRLRFGRATRKRSGATTSTAQKHANLGLAQVPPEKRPKERYPIKIFGIKIADRETPIEVRRQFVTRFGEIARIEARGRQVTGDSQERDRVRPRPLRGQRLRRRRARVGRQAGRRRPRQSADPLDRAPPHPPLDAAPYRLHGTVHTQQGDFTGFVQWDRRGVRRHRRARRPHSRRRAQRAFRHHPFDCASPRDGALVTLLDGREIALTGGAEVGRRNRGIYVDDLRYGRVRISWDAFLRVDFGPGGSGPAYGDFPPGRFAHGKRHHPRLPPPRRPARLRPRRERDRRDARRVIPGRGLQHPVRPGRLDRVPGGEELDAKHASVSLQAARSCSSSAPAISASGMPAC